MPTAPIDSAGTHFYYEDTGAPGGATRDYTTFVLLHGLGFNLNVFKKLFPYAKDNGIRMIAFNTRDYNGSTPYSAAEIQELFEPEAQNGGDAVRKWTREIAAFLVYVTTALGIPPIKTSQGATSGGLIFMPWSMGNVAPMAMLGDPEAVNEETRLHLGSYLRKVFMLDPPSNVLGIPATGLYDPLEDASLSYEERLQVFPMWVSKHHSSVTDLASVSVETLGARTILSDRGQLTDIMSPSELESVNNASAVPNALVVPGIPTKVLLANVERSFLNADLFPDVEVLVLWAEQSVWHCLWGPKAIYDMVQASTEGKKKRRVAFQRIPECNHFPHWERPEELVKIIAANA